MHPWRRLGRVIAAHEEGALYVLAALVYVPSGVLLRSIALNWIVGILFPLFVVSVVPSLVRRARGAKEAGA